MLGLLTLGLALLSASPRGPVAIPLPNASFEAPLAGTWECVPSGAGRVERDRTCAHAGTASARLSPGGDEVCLSLAGKHRIEVKPGQAFKLLAWLRAEGATGENGIALDGYRERCARGVQRRREPRHDQSGQAGRTQADVRDEARAHCHTLGVRPPGPSSGRDDAATGPQVAMDAA